MHCFSLLLLGMFLSSLATLNFSLSLMVGLLSTPLSFVVRPYSSSTSSTTTTSQTVKRWAASALLQGLAPTSVLVVWSSVYWGVGDGGGMGVGEVLRQAAFGWRVWGMYTSVVIWGVWWPAWLVGAVVVLGRPEEKGVV